MAKARERTDKHLNSTEKQLIVYYNHNKKRILKIFNKYYRRHKDEFDKKYEELQSGAISKDEYKAYMNNMIMFSSEWQKTVNDIVSVMTDINQNALSGIVNEGLEQIYIDNYNATIKSIGGDIIES